MFLVIGIGDGGTDATHAKTHLGVFLLNELSADDTGFSKDLFVVYIYG